jgi:hypothetical protein
MSTLFASYTKIVNSWAVQQAVGFLVIRFLIPILHRISAERINARFEFGTFVSFDPTTTAVGFLQNTYIIKKKKNKNCC